MFEEIILYSKMYFRHIHRGDVEKWIAISNMIAHNKYRRASVYLPVWLTPKILKQCRANGSEVELSIEDEAALTDGAITLSKFELPTKERALFVIHNRSREFKDIASEECNLDNKYDLVIGSVANDDLALLFRQFSNGLINVDTLVREMKFKKLTNQYSFHTKKAIVYLRKEGILRE